MASFVALKVGCKDLGATKTIQVQRNDSIHEVCKEVRTKFGERAGGADHGLFYPVMGKWLLPNKTVEFYDLKNLDVLEFKKKHRPIKVRMLDGALKTVIIDESLPVSMLVTVICEKIGISNADEYSLIPETTAAAPAKKERKEKKDKMAAEVRWLNPDKTLAEQSISENDAVILKKKFFFTDQNVDKNDPIQLNLLFNQAKDSILTGKHPCTMEEAIQFAAIMCQITFGNHDSGKHRPGFIVLKEYLPIDYVKKKDVEKKIYVDHGKLVGMNPINAKNRYVQLSRSLKTYGYTFFLVKERNKKDKNKLVEFLLGITKQTLVRVDAETKEVINQWQITQLRRWAASPNSFTLDFGDYADAYYTVQTAEGDQISQLIAGYIDIILKKKKEAEKVTPDEGMATVEEYMKPGKAFNSTVLTSGQRIAVEARQGEAKRQQHPFSFATFDDGVLQLDGGSPTQQTATMAIKNAFAMIRNSIGDLNNALVIPPLGNDAASLHWKQQTIDVNANNITSVVAMQLATIGSLILNVTSDTRSMDFDQISSSIGQLPNLLNQLNQSLKTLRAILDNEQLKDQLLQVALDLSNALAAVIDKSQPLCMGEAKATQEFHDAAKYYSTNASELLSCLELLEVLDGSEQDLLDACNAVGVAVAELIAIAKVSSEKLNDIQAVKIINETMVQTFDSTNRLIITTMVVCPTITTQICKDRVVEGSLLLRENLELLCNSFDETTDQSEIEEMAEASFRIEEALANLFHCTSIIGNEDQPFSEIDEQFNVVLYAIGRFANCFESPEDVIFGARDITLNTTQFISLLKRFAMNAFDNDSVLETARHLADATSKLVLSAKVCSKDFDNDKMHEELIESVKDVRNAVIKASTQEIRSNALHRLARLLKDVILSSNQISNSSRSAAVYNRNQQAQHQLNASMNRVADVNTNLITAVKNYNSDPRDFQFQRKLMKAARCVKVPALATIDLCEATISSIGDSFARAQLSSALDLYTYNVEELDKLLSLVDELLAQSGAKDALLSIKEMEDTLLDSQFSSSNNRKSVQIKRRTIFDAGAQKLQESINASSNPTQDLLAAIGEVSKTMDLLSNGGAVDQQHFNTQAILSLQTLTNAVREFSLMGNSEDFKSDLYESALLISGALSKLIESSEDVEETNQDDMLAVAHKGLARMIDTIPAKREMDEFITDMNDLFNSYSPVTNLSFEDDADWSKEVRTSIFAVQNAISDLTSSAIKTPQAIKSKMTDFKVAITRLNHASLMVDTDEKPQVFNALKLIGAMSSNFMEGLRDAFVNPGDEIKIAELAVSSKNVSDGVNSILGVCCIAKPGEVEAMKTMRQIANLLSKLDNPNESVTSNSEYSTIASQTSLKVKQIGILSASFTKLMISKNEYEALAKLNDITPMLDELTTDVCKLAFIIGASASDFRVSSYELEYITAVSPAGIIAQKGVIEANRALLICFSGYVNAARELFSDPDDEDSSHALSLKARETASALQALVKCITHLSPDQRKCQETILKINDISQLVDDIINEAGYGAVPVPNMGEPATPVECAKALDSLMDCIYHESESNGSQLSSLIIELPSVVEQIVDAVIVNVTAKFAVGNEQSDIFGILKELVESISAFSMCIKAAALTSSNSDSHQNVENSRNDTQASLLKLLNSLQGAASTHVEFKDTLTLIETAVGSISQPRDIVSGRTLKKETQACFKYAKKLSDILSELSSHSKHADTYHISTVELGSSFGSFLTSAVAAGTLLDDTETKAGIIGHVSGMGSDCCRIIELMRFTPSKDSSDQGTRTKISNISRDLSAAMIAIFAHLKAGNKHAETIDSVSSLVANAISDVDTIIIFAQAGQLDPANIEDCFKAYRDTLAKDITEFEESLVGFGASSISIEGVANLASQSCDSLAKLCDTVKLAAASITSSDKDMQVQLLSACKIISETLQLVILNSTDEGVRDKIPGLLLEQDAIIDELKRLIRILGDESTKGFRAMESLSRDIDDMVRELESDAMAEGTALPEEVVTLAKELMVLSGSVSAFTADKQTIISLQCNKVVKLLDVLLKVGKAATCNAPEEKNAQMIKSLKRTAFAIQALFMKKRECLEEGGKVDKLELQKETKEMNSASVDLVQIATKLIPAGYIDANDPNVIAERKLLAVVRSIDTSAKRISTFASFSPASPSPYPDEDLFEEDVPTQYGLLDVARTVIMGATALVKSSTGLQRELCAKGELTDGDLSWNNGVVSEADLLAEYIEDLSVVIEVAMNGTINYERTIVVAHLIVTQTTRLVIAATQHIDTSSSHVIRLKASSKVVIQSSENLARAAEGALKKILDAELSKEFQVKKTTTARMSMEIDTQVNILRMENELDRARTKLQSVRKNDGKPSPNSGGFSARLSGHYGRPQANARE